MKIPAVWLAAAFATGVLLRPAGHSSAAPWLIAAGIFILAGAATAKFLNTLWPAAILALAAWCALGAASLSIEHVAVPHDNINRLIAAGKFDTSEPLRWRGLLREDPLRLPWGARYMIDIESVEFAGRALPAQGGLRANYFWKKETEEPLPQLRAGDRVEALVRARRPRNFMDPGAPDTRAILERDGIDVIGTLRNLELLQKIDSPRPTLAQYLARARGTLLNQIDAAFPNSPEVAAILRAMLLGDRMFVDSNVALDFQKTGAFHVLVLAGLHVGILCAFFLWLGRKLRSPLWLTAIVTLTALALYLGIVQDRPPILRATLMAALFLSAQPLYRRVALLNTVAVAAVLLLAIHPTLLRDMSFELSFLAAGSIAGLALPWIDRTSAGYLAGLHHLGDVPRDLSFSPKVAQFRIDLRSIISRLAALLPAQFAPAAERTITLPLRAGIRFWELLILSCALQIGMLGMLALDFHRVALVAPASNVPAVLLTGLIIPIGFLTLGGALIWKPLAAPFAWALGGLVKMLLATVHWFASLPFLSSRTPAPPVWLLAAAFATLVIVCIFARRNAVSRAVRISRIRTRSQLPSRSARLAELAIAAALAIFTFLAAAHPFAPQLPRGKLELTVLDVGQGDSIFASFPDGRTMLIDGGGEPGSIWTHGLRAGPDIGEDVVAPYLWSRGIKRVDVVALSHAHHDHMDGLRAVLNDFSVGELWVGLDSDVPAFRELLQEAKSRGVKIIYRHLGERLDFGGAQVTVVWPPEPGDIPLTTNNDSLVLSVQNGATRFLLPGDVEAKAEKELIASGENVSADFLKVPHHGSKSSSTEPFLAGVAPRFAVISVGEGNPFGHPNVSVVARYEEKHTRLFRTDQDGAVTTESDGHNLTVKSYREIHNQN
jgi:competence protein ComEC